MGQREQHLAIAYAADFARVDAAFAGDRPGLEAWVAAQKPFFVFAGALSGSNDLLGGWLSLESTFLGTGGATTSWLSLG